MLFVILLEHAESNPIILKTSVKKNKGINEFAKKLKELMAKKEKNKKRN